MNLRLKAVALATLVFGSMSVSLPGQSSTLFSKAEIDPSRFVAVASPYANGARHQLLILEQVANTRACWSESGSYPTRIDPLLLQYDFTNICGRSTDSNGYSIRMADRDLGVQYSLRVVERGGELRLVGVPLFNRTLPELEIGRTYGVTNGFAKIFLNSGWRMTRRTYNGQAVGHVYLTNDRSLESVVAALPKPTTPTTPTTPTRPVTPRPTQPPTSSRPQPLPPPPNVNPAPVNPAPSRPVFRPGAGDYVVPTIIIEQ
ncbi:MAG TPA: DUF3747 domain-containing protein [Leptolyngbyaceae cyanobacterium M33_DOE_097]|uniref:DUF3747 domain-containing protein n=1 Tax=Oscillatoriales cyanobacterium SpSt-418 TaxID=2282169 RepID=A0A7C3PFY1_9CYAN|nr:DUF3747 domain-containing protein [Leptolyngbyaceae cyanobacterium M33_DOE_097]